MGSQDSWIFGFLFTGYLESRNPEIQIPGTGNYWGQLFWTRLKMYEFFPKQSWPNISQNYPTILNDFGWNPGTQREFPTVPSQRAHSTVHTQAAYIPFIQDTPWKPPEKICRHSHMHDGSKGSRLLYGETINNPPRKITTRNTKIFFILFITPFL